MAAGDIDGPGVRSRVKRYTDPQDKRTRTNCLRYTLFTSAILLGVAVVLTVVLVLLRPKPIKPPATSMVNDADFVDYLGLQKAVYAWSHTEASQISGRPAYTEIFTNAGGSRDHLLGFLQKHNITSVYLYAGCAEWDSQTWAQGELPYQSEMEQTIRALRDKGVESSLVLYVNDDKADFSGYASLEDAGRAIATMNSRLGSYYGVRAVSVFLDPSGPEQYVYALESLALLSRGMGAQRSAKLASLATGDAGGGFDSRSDRSRITRVLRDAAGSLPRLEVTVSDTSVSAAFSFKKELHGSLAVAPVISEFLAAEGAGEPTFGAIAGRIAEVAHVLLNSTSEYVLTDTWARASDAFRVVQPVYNMDPGCYGERAREDPGAFLHEVARLQGVCGMMFRPEAGDGSGGSESSGDAAGQPEVASEGGADPAAGSCGVAVISSYLDMHNAMYGLEPRGASDGFLIDLYTKG